VTSHTDVTERAVGFRRDGACVVRGLLDGDELALLERAVERNLAEPSERAIEGGGDAGSGRFFEDFRNWTRIPGYERVIRESRLGEVAAELTGSRTVRLHHDHLLVKEPGTTIRTPWHQDQPFYNIDGFQTVSFWIPLDPVPRESTLEFVAGSHATRTWYMPRSFFDDRALVFDEGTFDEVPDVEADRGAYTILGWALEPGDAVAFNMLTLHAAAGSRNRRRAFSVRLVGDDVRLAARPHKTSPSFPELDGVLDHGDRLEHPLFPRLWPRDAAARQRDQAHPDLR
jgi:ectoine hydroxylase-related dioxygenase (phytanoyl-CoA dioxygenase family)